MEKSTGIARYIYPGRVGAADWDAFATALLNAGLSYAQIEQQIKLEKAKAAANPAYTPQLPAPGGYGITNYMPFIIGGVALVALFLIMKKR